MAAPVPGETVILKTLGGFQVACCPPKKGVVHSIDPALAVLFDTGLATFAGTESSSLFAVGDVPDATFIPTYAGRAVRVTGLNGASPQELTGVVADAFLATETVADAADVRGFVVIHLTGRGENGSDQFLVLEVESDFSNVGSLLQLLPDADFPRH
jgi:hypothetical protein